MMDFYQRCTPSNMLEFYWWKLDHTRFDILLREAIFLSVILCNFKVKLICGSARIDFERRVSSGNHRTSLSLVLVNVKSKLFSLFSREFRLFGCRLVFLVGRGSARGVRPSLTILLGLCEHTLRHWPRIGTSLSQHFCSWSPPLDPNTPKLLDPNRRYPWTTHTPRRDSRWT